MMHIGTNIRPLHLPITSLRRSLVLLYFHFTLRFRQFEAAEAFDCSKVISAPAQPSSRRLEIDHHAAAE